MSEITLTVIGEPAPQGSKAPYGGESNKKTAPWRATVSAAAAELMDGREPFLGCCGLEVTFYFPRPKNHYGTGRNAAVLKSGADTHVAKKPDLDKLLRAIGDALTGYVVRDDAQFGRIAAEKLYGTPRAVIRVYELETVR